MIQNKVYEVNALVANISKVPLYEVDCPHCGDLAFWVSHITLAKFRENYTEEKCPHCGKIIHLGKVINW